MSGYTPVFDSVFDGTLCGKWPTLPVWLSILPLADAKGHIDMTPEAISIRTGWPMELLLQGLHELMQPDPRSRSKKEDGRRLVLIDSETLWGWKVVNIGKYREKASGRDQIDDGRNAEKVRRYKERHRETPQDAIKHQSDTHSYSDTNTDLKEEKKNPLTPLKGVQQVFEHWKIEWEHPDAYLDLKRAGKIQLRLKRFTVEQVCKAISGFKNSDWHTGRDPKGGGKIYDKIETLLRDDSQVEEGIRLFDRPPRPPPALENLSPGERVMRAYGANGNDRVVSEQFGSGSGDVEEPLRRLRPALPS